MDPQAPKQDAVEYFQAQRRIALALAELDRVAAGASLRELDGRFERAMLVVARHAVAPHTFELHRKRIADLGRAFVLPELFDLVAGELPGWCSWGESADDIHPWSSRAALRRLVTHGQTHGERGERFSELSGVAVRLTAQGSLGRASSALAEAESLVDQAAVTPEVVESVRGSGSEGIDLEILRPFSTSPSEQPSLRRFLSFFRVLHPVALLQALATEKTRERRRLILALLEAQGEPARNEALDLLGSDLAPTMDEAEMYLRRNFIYLLTRVPRSVDDGLDEEVAVLARHAAPQLPPILVKEAIKALSQVAGRRSERALQRQRQLLQEMLAGTTPPAATYEDLRVYLERTEAALDRRATGGKAAGQTPGRPTSPKPSQLAGESLPSFLQGLAEESASGDLVVEDKARGVAVWFKLSDGRLTFARAGRLGGADAVYQLLETFDGGECAWTSQPGTKVASTGEREGLDLRPLLLEGLRRRDELGLARALVPDEAVFAPKTSEPRPHPDEKDGLVTRDVWEAAIGGQTPRLCEAAVEADAYRIRRLYLHWLEEDALEPALLGGRPSRSQH
jgi:hypothetical protein